VSTSSTQCRFCGRQVSSHDIRHRSPYQCCRLCVDLVSSLDDSPPPEFYAILMKKPSQDLRQLTGHLISKHGLQHKRIDDQTTIFDLVGTLRRELEDEIIRRMLQYDKDLVLLAFLRLLNATCNMSLPGSHAASQGNQSLDQLRLLHRVLSVNEKSLESLVERCLILPAASYKNRKAPDIADIRLILELAKQDYLLFQFVEDQLCIKIGTCGLTFDDHEWHLDRDKDSEAVFGKIMDELALEEKRVSESTASQEADKFSNPDALLEEYQSLGRGTGVPSPSLLNDDEVEFIKKIDGLHQQSFGYKYSELMTAYLLLIRRCAYSSDLGLRWDFDSQLTHYLTQHIPLAEEEATNIIETMSMSEAKIPKGQPVFQFKRETRIVRNPIVMTQIGQRRLCLYSASFLIRSCSHVSIEYAVGNHPLLLKRPNSVLSEIQRINQSVKDYFVHSRISPLLSSKGFRVKPFVKSVGGTSIITPQCGEIDILAYDDTEGTILLVECKHTIDPVISSRQVRNSVSEYEDEGGFVDVLTRKLDWITTNIDKVRQEFAIVTTDLVCKGMFVTNLYEPASEIIQAFPIVDEEELRSFDARQIVAIARPSHS